MRWWAVAPVLMTIAATVPGSSRRVSPARVRSVFRTVQENADDLATGAVLVSAEALKDPNFVKAVIVLVQYDEDEGAMGLVLNRRTEATLGRMIPDLKSGEKHLVYSGGPVQPEVMQVLFRARSQPEAGIRVTRDVYATADAGSIRKLADSSPPARFHSYLGYAGWSGGQLEQEVALGAWTVIAPDPSVLFDDDPDSLWQRLNRRGQMRMAAAPLLPWRTPRRRPSVTQTPMPAKTRAPLA